MVEKEEMTDIQFLDIDPREINDIAKDNQQIVNHILMIADSVRYVLGDNLKGIKGREVRKVGRID